MVLSVNNYCQSENVHLAGHAYQLVCHIAANAITVIPERILSHGHLFVAVLSAGLNHAAAA